MSGAETRRYTRRAIAAEFVLHDQEGASGGQLAFDATDISEGGAFLRSELLLDVGDIIDVRFRLGGGAEHAVRARVAWVSRGKGGKGDAGMGLEFTEIDANARAAIATFIAAMLD
jgi:hypothetical protein